MAGSLLTQDFIARRPLVSSARLILQAMEVFRSLEAYRSTTGPTATIGTFDGVHRGHQVILHQLVATAQRQQRPSLVITFHPHPRVVLGKAEGLFLLNTLDERLARLEAAGVDQTLVIPFTREFAGLTSTDFIEGILHQQVGVKHLAIGYDHRFGRNRGGGLEELTEAGQRLGFSVQEIPAQQIDDATVSSTKIRAALEAGQVEAANRMLGYRYPLTGTVVEGDQIGRDLGYPTANLEAWESEKLVPAFGVYACEVQTPDGALWRGMLNWGVRPTLKEGLAKRLEVNLLDFEGDLYGKLLTVRYLARIRPEEKFDGLDALKAQLAKDRQATEAIFQEPPSLETD